MNIDNLTLGELKQIFSSLGGVIPQSITPTTPAQSPSVPDLNTLKRVEYPMLGKRCVVRTYSAGVHIGDVVWINPNNAMEIKLENSLRLWEWTGGRLSLSAVASNGIKGGRLNKTGEVMLTNVIELIPTTPEAEETYAKFIED